MTDVRRRTASRRKSATTKLLYAGTFITAGIVFGITATEARTTKIQILTRTVAFGGYEFPKVGPYEYITGIATGEINPNNPLNAVIVDIKLAPRNSRGNVEYQHNFYILKPVDLKKGNHKMMYEPPNRGGKTYQTLNNTPGGQRSGSDCRSDRTCQFVPVDSRLHHDLERLGARSRPAHRAHCDGVLPDRERPVEAARLPARLTNTSSPAARRSG